ITEAARLRFRRVVVPVGSPDPDPSLAGRVELVRVDTVSSALARLDLRHRASHDGDVGDGALRAV
ncbi:MAG: hypothetical protein AAGF91_16215, partial [Actinomycetota bacterium]